MTLSDQAVQIAASCWQDDETSNIVMDVKLANAFARRVDSLLEDARMFARNADFYHGIVTEIGEMFGDAAKTSDDGTVQQDVLALRVPELVASLIAKHKAAHD